MCTADPKNFRLGQSSDIAGLAEGCSVTCQANKAAGELLSVWVCQTSSDQMFNGRVLFKIGIETVFLQAAGDRYFDDFQPFEIFKVS